MTAIDKNGAGVEHRLKSAAPPPLPPGLRGRILGAAKADRDERSWTTPALRVLLVGGAILVVIALAADAIVSHQQTVGLEALVGEPKTVSSGPRIDLAGLPAELRSGLDREQLALLGAEGARMRPRLRAINVVPIQELKEGF